MQKTHFYITTPIYYANAVPHIGNAYTSFIADVYARTHRLLGYQVKFTTGTDENGQKMVQTAEKEGKQVMEFLDEIAGLHRYTWDRCKISYTDFIRTTEQRHYDFVQKVLQKSYDVGDIYQGEYDGLYCIGCEGFKKESDLTPEGLCPDHLKKPEIIKEKNRFFRLSNYQDKLLEFYKKQQDFCIPSHRFNEVISFVENGLEDFSISRQGSNFGIPLPFDTESVTYIWFDALYNYVTSCQGGDEVFWSKDCEKVHTIGKDISRFHAIYRPAMLWSAGYELPDMELINGFFTIDGQKMSKSLGNSLNPVELIEEYGRDALLYYLFADIKLGSDGDFSRERLVAQKDSNLKNGWSNLVNRVVSILKKQELVQLKVEHTGLRSLIQFFNKHKKVKEEGANECINFLFRELQYLLIVTMNTIIEYDGHPITLDNFIKNLIKGIKTNYFDTANISQYLADRYEIVGLLNAYIASTEPRKTIKQEETKQATIDQLQAILFVIKYLAIMISPFLVEGTEKLKDILQFDNPAWKGWNTDGDFIDTATLEEVLSFRYSGLHFGEGYIYS